MLTDDEYERIRHMIAAELNKALDTRGLKELPSAAALRTRRYRERKASQNVTRKSHRTSHIKEQSVTKASPVNVTPSKTTWEAYAQAYRLRYGVDPTRNAMVNGLLAQFVARVPAADAPLIAAFFVRHNKAFYISSKHAVGGLLHDAEGLRTEWLSGRTVTDTEARQADQTQARGNVFGKLIAEEEERHGK